MVSNDAENENPYRREYVIARVLRDDDWVGVVCLARSGRRIFEISITIKDDHGMFELRVLQKKVRSKNESKDVDT